MTREDHTQASATDGSLPAPLDLLRREAESIPKWLATYQQDAPFPREAFFSSRIVYYPGFGDDGHPLRLFGRAHAAHCFVFSDYMHSAEHYEEHLLRDDHRYHPKGYRALFVKRLHEKDLVPEGWSQHVSPDHLPKQAQAPPPGGPFALWAVLERKEDYGDEHGPKRLALLVVGGEAVATYDALFCQEAGHPPYAVLIQDHGFGGGWTKFGGADSLLYKLASQHGLPKWALIAENGTKPWPGYPRVSTADSGGMHNFPRWLHRKSQELEE